MKDFWKQENCLPPWVRLADRDYGVSATSVDGYLAKSSLANECPRVLERAGHGSRIASFQVLAAGDATFEERDHGWYLDVADRLATAAPDLVRTTRWIRADLADDASTAAAADWWLDLTAAEGEGILVKPYANFTRTAKGSVQPGMKVRGREYLRIIYGPDQTDEANLTRLHDRDTGHKRLLAAREYALGLEGLHRYTAGEPLWRVH